MLYVLHVLLIWLFASSLLSRLVPNYLDVVKDRLAKVTPIPTALALQFQAGVTDTAAFPVSPPLPEPQSRVVVSDQILQKILSYAVSKGCTSFDHIVTVPPKNVLYQQSIRRYQEDMGVSEEEAISRIAKTNWSNKSNEKWQKFIGIFHCCCVEL